MKIYILLLLFNLNNFNAKFVNYVEYPQNKDVYKFDLIISQGLSMSVRNDKRVTWDPAIYDKNNSVFVANFDKNNNFNCKYDQIVTNKSEEESIITAAGFHRELLLINNQFPGPSIVVPLNSQIEITVHNHLLTSVLSLHWHGMIQKHTFYHDGVGHLTQCPIGPMESYTYKFKADNLGTHWYHSHSGTQRQDGLYGAFIVYDPDEKEKKNEKLKSKKLYDEEFYLFVQDWNQRMSEEMYIFPLFKNFKYTRGYNNPSLAQPHCENRLRIDDGSILPTVPPDTVLMNGKNWFELPLNISDLKNLGPDILKYPLESFLVKPNEKYLFRIVGANSAYSLQISIEGHKFRVVSTDGNKIEPIEDVEVLIVHGGERYDIELETKTNTFANNYLIIVKLLAVTDEKFDDLTRDFYAIGFLKYENAEYNVSYQLRECNSKTPCRTVNCPFKKGRNNRFECINAESFKSLPHETLKNSNLFKSHYTPEEFEEYSLNLHFAGFIEARSSINGKQFHEPKQPPFFPLNYKDAIHVCPEDCVGQKTCQCTQIIDIKPGKVIQFTFYHMGMIDGLKCTNHPLHLHGHHFYVVSQQYPDYYENGTFMRNHKDINCPQDSPHFCNNVGWSDERLKNGNISNANFKNPVKKDTIIVPCGGYTTIRFLADNPGYWMMHCHIDNHHANGMALVIKEGTQEQIKNLVKLDEINTCYKGYEGHKLKFNKKDDSWILFGILLGVLVTSVSFNIVLIIYGYSLSKKRSKAGTSNQIFSEKEIKNINTEKL